MSRKSDVISSFTDLNVYQKASSLVRQIFQLSGKFPREEQFSLTDQVRRSSRSVAANIAEGWAKRRFENTFKRHLVDAYGSCIETKVWLVTAFDCGYISENDFRELTANCEEVGKMLYSLMKNWRNYNH